MWTGGALCSLCFFAMVCVGAGGCVSDTVKRHFRRCEAGGLETSSFHFPPPAHPPTQQQLVDESVNARFCLHFYIVRLYPPFLWLHSLLTVAPYRSPPPPPPISHPSLPIRPCTFRLGCRRSRLGVDTFTPPLYIFRTHILLSNATHAVIRLSKCTKTQKQMYTNRP